MLKPRLYQIPAINTAIDFFLDKKKYNGLSIQPGGSGKSVITANVAAELPGKTLVLQPSKEVLIQNYKKFVGYGYKAGIYSASVGQKQMDKVTFATIGSIANKKHILDGVEHIILDECHLANPEEGQYKDVFTYLKDAKVLGLTATPYRLHSNSWGSELRFLTRTKTKIFNKVIHYTQNEELFAAGHLCPIKYFSFKVANRRLLHTNGPGSQFTDQSIKAHNRTVKMPQKTIEYANRILKVKPNLLVICSLVEEAKQVAANISGAVVLTGDNKGQRDSIVLNFMAGKIRCVVVVGMLGIGFDYPALSAILIARSTLSLAYWAQWIPRVCRPHESKEEAWVVDLGDNLDLFGKIETMRIEQTPTGLYYISNNGKQLTNVPFNTEQRYYSHG